MGRRRGQHGVAAASKHRPGPCPAQPRRPWRPCPAAAPQLRQLGFEALLLGRQRRRLLALGLQVGAAASRRGQEGGREVRGQLWAAQQPAAQPQALHTVPLQPPRSAAHRAASSASPALAASASACASCAARSSRSPCSSARAARASRTSPSSASHSPGARGRRRGWRRQRSSGARAGGASKVSLAPSAPASRQHQAGAGPPQQAPAGNAPLLACSSNWLFSSSTCGQQRWQQGAQGTQ